MAGLKITCFDCGQGNRVPADKLASGAKCGTCGARLLAQKPQEVDLAWLQKASKIDDVPLVVDFWAPWCGPCRMMAPEYAKAAARLGGQARLVKLNTEDHPKASTKYNIRGIPMLAMFKGGREVARQAGAMPSDQIVSWIKSAS
ncbi:MAG: thioredoxin TrxC [Marinosulfonomonas sp.]